MATKPLADIVVRVSDKREREGESFIAPEVQVEQASLYLSFKGFAKGQVHEDIDVPAEGAKKKSVQHGLREAMARVEAGKTQAIAVAAIDRFGRDPIEIHRNIEAIKKAGGHLLSAQEGINTADQGWLTDLLVGLFATLAKMQRAKIGEGWATARTRAVGDGVHICGFAPLGYVQWEKKKRRRQPLEADVLWAPVVEELWLRAAAGQTFYGLADWLNELDAPTQRGGKWTTQSVSRLLQNRVYLGEATGVEGVVTPGAHKALVRLDVFEAVQRRRGGAQGRTGDSSGLSVGVARCAGCSYALQPKFNRALKRRYYVCRGKHAAGKCSAPAHVTIERLDEYVRTLYLELASGLYAEGAGDGAVTAEAELATAQAAFELYRDNADLKEALGGAESADYLGGLRKKREARDAAAEKVAAAKDSLGALAGKPTRMSVEDWFDGLTLEEQRRLVASAFPVIFVKQEAGSRALVERVHALTDASGLELPKRGRRNSIRPFVFPGGPEQPTREAVAEHA